MPSAKDFQAQFLDLYQKARELHREEWDDIWRDTNRWSNLMIYSETGVVRSAADRLGLKCYPKEPLHFDAVFVDKRNPPWDWFPIVAAVEHENNPYTFDGEIKKLLTIRCSLKVGITYILLDRTRLLDRATYVSNLSNKIMKSIVDLFGKASTAGDEDPRTEYLFLIGIETENPPQELRWLSVDFRAADGPKTDQNFEPALTPVGISRA